MLAAVSRCKQPLGRSAAVGLIVAGLAILALPTFRPSQAAAPQEPAAGATAAGDSPAAGAANPSTARDGAANSTATVEELIEQLLDWDPEVRGQAAEALGELGPAAAPAIPALIEALADDGIWDAFGPPDKWELDSQGVLHRSIIYGRRVMRVNTTAEDALVAIGSPAVEPLIDASKDLQRDVNTRNRLLRLLARIGDPRTATLLVDQFDRSRAGFNLLGAPYEIFRTPGDPAAALAVVDLLRERLNGPQGAAILSDMGRYWNFLGRKTSRISMREDAREALTGVLREHLGDPSPVVRATVADLLGRFGAEGSEALRNQLGESLRKHAGDDSVDVRLAVALAQAELGVSVDNADPLLYAAVVKSTPPNPDLRLRVMKVLGRTGDPRALPVLIDALKDPTPAVRNAAVRSLGDQKVPDALDALLIAIRDSDEGVAIEAIYTLDQFADSLTAAPLLALANDSDNAQVRRRAGLAARYIAHPGGGYSEIAWGEPVGDLQLGLRWQPAGGPVRIGEVVEYHWVMRNQGTHDRTIRMDPSQDRRRLVEGRKINLGAAEPTFEMPSRERDSGWILVRPGTMVSIGAKAYCFRPEEWRESDAPMIGLPVSPGRYQVHASFVGTVRGDATAGEFTRVTLTSGTLEFEVANDDQGSGSGPPR